MLEAYSLNVTAGAGDAIPFNSVSVDKNCDESLPSATTIALNHRGVYKVHFDSSLEAAGSVQLFKDGIAQPQAQATGTNPNFCTLVQVPRENTGCCCINPVTIQIKNTGTASATFTNCHIIVRKIR